MNKLFLKILMISFLFCTVACGDKPAGPVDGENGIPGENGDNPGGEETPKDEILEFSVTGDFELDEGETTKYVVDEDAYIAGALIYNTKNHNDIYKIRIGNIHFFKS